MDDKKNWNQKGVNVINNRNNMNTDDMPLSVLENYAGPISQYTPAQARIVKRFILNEIHNNTHPPSLEEKGKLEKCLVVMNEILDRETNKLSCRN